MELVVHPENFNEITRCFDRKKGLDIALSPEEINESIEGGSLGGGSKHQASTGLDEVGWSSSQTGGAADHTAMSVELLL